MKARVLFEKTPGTSLEQRIFLICFGAKCMSGRVEEVIKIEEPSTFELQISFISPEYFANEIQVNAKFTLQEASKILANGVVLEGG